MRFKHIIWDWNGTIIDDASLSLDILNQTLTKRRLQPLSLEKYRASFDFPVSEFYERLGFDFSKESVDKVGREFVDAYNKAQANCPMRNGILEILKRVADSPEMSQSVLSAYEKSCLSAAVKMRKLESFFDFVSGLDNIYAGSKEALGKRHIAKINLPAGSVLMVGDTLHDFDTAKAMGIPCALLCGGHFSRQRLETAGVPVFDNTEELMRYLSL